MSRLRRVPRGAEGVSPVCGRTWACVARAETDAQKPPRGALLKNALKQILPWLITLLVLAFIGFTTDLATAWSTLQRADWIGFIPAVIGVCLVVFVVDSWCLVRLFSRFNADVTLREVLPLKGASYLLNVINYNAAAAGIALFFRNRKRVPFIEALGSMLWLNFIDIVSLALLVLIGMGVSPRALSPELAGPVAGVAIFVLLVLLGSCIYWNAGFDWFFFGRFRSWRIFKAFSTARLSDYAFFLALRLGFVSTYVVSQSISMPFFQMEASLPELFLFVPVLTFVGTIPFTTIAGLGTVQVLMRTFYEPFTPGYATAVETHAHIDAYSTTTILAFVLVRILIAMFTMRNVAMGVKTPEVPADEASPA